MFWWRFWILTFRPFFWGLSDGCSKVWSDSFGVWIHGIKGECKRKVNRQGLFMSKWTPGKCTYAFHSALHVKSFGGKYKIRSISSKLIVVKLDNSWISMSRVCTPMVTKSKWQKSRVIPSSPLAPVLWHAGRAITRYSDIILQFLFLK